MRQAIVAHCAVRPVSAWDLLDAWYQSAYVLPFQCAPVDTALRGGLYSGEVTELVGRTVTGKTQVRRTCPCTTAVPVLCARGGVSADHERLQLSMQAAVSTVYQYADATVLFIDTLNACTPERLHQIAQRFRSVRARP